MPTGRNPVRNLPPRLQRINHTALQQALADLRTENSRLDYTPPPASLILARTRVQARKEEAALHANLLDLMAETFPPFKYAF